MLSVTDYLCQIVVALLRQNVNTLKACDHHDALPAPLVQPSTPSLSQTNGVLMAVPTVI
jgi:hypothetical protein